MRCTLQALLTREPILRNLHLHFTLYEFVISSLYSVRVCSLLNTFRPTPAVNFTPSQRLLQQLADHLFIPLLLKHHELLPLYKRAVFEKKMFQNLIFSFHPHQTGNCGAYAHYF